MRRLLKLLASLFRPTPVRKVRPLTSDEEATRAHYIKRDREKVKRMKSTRHQDYELWRVNFREAEYILHQRRFRQMWDGSIDL